MAYLGISSKTAQYQLKKAIHISNLLPSERKRINSTSPSKKLLTRFQQTQQNLSEKEAKTLHSKTPNMIPLTIGKEL